MLRTIALLSMLGLMIAPVAAADHLGPLNPEFCQDPNIFVNAARALACTAWNDGLAPTYHAAAELVVNVREAVYTFCDTIGNPCR